MNREKEVIKSLCKINYENATNLINNNIIDMKEYKEMVFKLIVALAGTRNE